MTISGSTATSGREAARRGAVPADAGALLLTRAGRAGVVARLEPATVIIGAGCDAEPLFEAESALVAAEPDAVVRGLGAAMLATGAARGLLAVRRDRPRALERARAAARATAIEVRAVDPIYPLDEVLADELDVVGAATFTARTLYDLDRAARDQPIVERWLSVAGDVARPRVAVVPIGTPIAELVGARSSAWVALSGALRGRMLDGDEVVDAALPGLLVLPPAHDLVGRRRASAAQELARARSACIECGACTAACPPALGGAPLLPQSVVRTLARGGARPGVTPGAVFCTGCGVCDLVCPAGLAPRLLVGALAAELRAADPRPLPLEQPAGAGARAPRGRRLALDLVTERLGLGRFAVPLALDPAPIAPRRVRVPVAPGLPLRARLGQTVSVGATLAPGVHASIAGVVFAIDADGIELRAESKSTVDSRQSTVNS